MDLIRYDDVADLYDLHVTVDRDVPFLVSEAQRVSGKVLELMAGTGRVSLPLVEAGVDLTCVDASEGMLERLRAKLRARGLSAVVHRLDIREFDLGERFALALIPFHSFSEIVEPDDAGRALRSVVGHLGGGGRLVVPLHNPLVRLREADGALRLTGSHVTDRGRLVVSGFERLDPLTRIVARTQFYELFDEQGRLESKRILEMKFRLHSSTEFEEIAGQAGLEPEALYGDYNYAEFDEQVSPFMIWVLRRK
jgi:SAM-dependent methyltransferase